jgi:hypothetical protein
MLPRAPLAERRLPPRQGFPDLLQPDLKRELNYWWTSHRYSLALVYDTRVIPAESFPQNRPPLSQPAPLPEAQTPSHGLKYSGRGWGAQIGAQDRSTFTVLLLVAERFGALGMPPRVALKSQPAGSVDRTGRRYREDLQSALLARSLVPRQRCSRAVRLHLPAP